MTQESPAARYLLWAVLGLPVLAIAGGYATGCLFYGEAVHLSGEWSVRLMIAAMAATPLGLLLPGSPFSRWLLKNRRYFGVASFAYAALHTAIYVAKTAEPASILAEALSAEYASGWLALLIFLILAVTSNDASVRLLKRGWKTLHRAVYAAAALTFAHWLFVAFDPLAAYAHLGLLLALEAYRLSKVRTLRHRDA